MRYWQRVSGGINTMRRYILVAIPSKRTGHNLRVVDKRKLPKGAELWITIPKLPKQ